MGKMWDDLKAINKITLLPKDYKADPILFRIFIAGVAIFLVFVGLSLPKDRAYFKCSQLDGVPVEVNGYRLMLGSMMPCENPFYKIDPCPFANPQQCAKQFVAPGEVLGSQPGLWYKLASPIVLSSLALAVALNHFLYNKGYFKKNKKKILKALEGESK